MVAGGGILYVFTPSRSVTWLAVEVCSMKAAHSQNSHPYIIQALLWNAGTLLFDYSIEEAEHQQTFIKEPYPGTKHTYQYVGYQKWRLQQSNGRLPLWARAQLVICPVDSLTNLTCMC
jgi:hypothetical protein